MTYDSDDLLSWLRTQLGSEYDVLVLKFQIERLTEENERLRAELDRSPLQSSPLGQSSAGARPFVGSYALPGEGDDRG